MQTRLNIYTLVNALALEMGNKKRSIINIEFASGDETNAEVIFQITSSPVSRFARNTVDSLTTVRKLKEKSIDVYFEKEHLHSCSAEGELMLTLMAARW